MSNLVYLSSVLNWEKGISCPNFFLLGSILNETFEIKKVAEKNDDSACNALNLIAAEEDHA